MACSANCSAACANGCQKGGTDSADNRYEGCACGGCGFGCAGGGGCTNTCTGTCSGSCSGCGGSCTGSCKDSCSGSCSGKCLGSCVNACKGSCLGQCLGGCSTACSGTCNHLCNTTCTNSVAETAYAFLSTVVDKLSKENWKNYSEHIEKYGGKDSVILNYLDSEDMNNMFILLKEEGRRRHLQLTESGQPIGEKNKVFDYNTLTNVQKDKIGGIDNEVIVNTFIDNDEIKKINDLLIKNANKSTGLSSVNSELVEGGSVNRAIGVALIKKMLEAYKDMVGVPSVSQSSGVQEN